MGIGPEIETKTGLTSSTTDMSKEVQENSKQDLVAEGQTEQLITGKGRFDIAAEFLKLHEGEQGSYTAEEARRLLWKIDFIIIPLLTITVIFNSVDKIIISNAALYGMTADAHLVGQQYSWVASIFFFGYLVAEFPANLAIQKIPVGKLIGGCAIGWAGTVMLMAACSNGAGLMTLRFLMGVFEAVTFPLCAVVTVMWYKKEEQPLRVAFWFGQWSSLFAGIISYGIGHTSTKIAPWRLLFLILGGATILWGLFLFFYMPNTPVDAKFLNDREKYIAIHRIKDNMTGIENRTTKWPQIREAFTDWKTWPLVIYQICMQIAGGGITTFSAQIVSGLGFSTLDTTLLGMPCGVIAFACSALVALPSSRLRNMRCYSVALWNLIPLVSVILIIKLPTSNKNGKLAAYYSLYSYWGGNAIITSMPMANTSGHSKKMTRNALMFVGYCVGNIIAPQFFKSSEAPSYPTGFRAIISAVAISIVCVLVYAFGVQIENKQKLKGLDATELEDIAQSDEALLDLTDKEKKGFIYIY